MQKLKSLIKLKSFVVRQYHWSILFLGMSVITRAHADTHASNFTCAIYCTHKIIVFSLLVFVIIIHFPKEIFHWRIFHWRLYRKFKTSLIVKTLQNIRCSLVSTNEILVIITWYGHSFMSALSQTMYLLEANVNFLPNTSTHDIAQYQLE